MSSNTYYENGRDDFYYDDREAPRSTNFSPAGTHTNSSSFNSPRDTRFSSSPLFEQFIPGKNRVDKHFENSP